MQIKVEAAARGLQPTKQAIAPQVGLPQLDEDRRSAQSLRPDERQDVATDCTHKNLLRLVRSEAEDLLEHHTVTRIMKCILQ